MLSGMYHTADEGKYLNYWMRNIPGYFSAAGLRFGNCLACPAYLRVYRSSYPALSIGTPADRRAFIPPMPRPPARAQHQT